MKNEIRTPDKQIEFAIRRAVSVLAFNDEGEAVGAMRTQLNDLVVAAMAGAERLRSYRCTEIDRLKTELSKRNLSPHCKKARSLLKRARTLLHDYFFLLDNVDEPLPGWVINERKPLDQFLDDLISHLSTQKRVSFTSPQKKEDEVDVSPTLILDARLVMNALKDPKLVEEMRESEASFQAAQRSIDREIFGVTHDGSSKPMRSPSGDSRQAMVDEAKKEKPNLRFNVRSGGNSAWVSLTEDGDDLAVVWERSDQLARDVTYLREQATSVADRLNLAFANEEKPSSLLPDGDLKEAISVLAGIPIEVLVDEAHCRPERTLYAWNNHALKVKHVIAARAAQTAQLAVNNTTERESEEMRNLKERHAMQLSYLQDVIVMKDKVIGKLQSESSKSKQKD